MPLLATPTAAPPFWAAATAAVAARDMGPISTLTTPYTYAAECTEIFKLTELTYSDTTATVIISDLSDTRFGACQPTGFTEVALTARFTFSPAVCPNGWTAYSLSTTANQVSTGWCCNSGYTLASATTDWPIDWAPQPCVKTIEEDTTTIAGVGAVQKGAVQVHAPWHISWQPSDTGTMWPTPPVWATTGTAQGCVETWTPGGAVVYRTVEETTKTAKGMSTSTEKGAGAGRTTATHTAVAVGEEDADDDEKDYENGVSVVDGNSTLFWFLVIGLPVLGTLALALCCMAVYYRRVTKRARRRRRRMIRRLKVKEVVT